MPSEITRSGFSRKQKGFVQSLFLNLILVMTVQNLSNTFVGLVDSACISYFLGDPGLSGIGLTSPILQIIAGLSQIFAVGGQLAITKLLSKGDKNNANKQFLCVFHFLLIIGIILALLFYFTSPFIAKILAAGGSSSTVLSIAADYLKGYVIGIPFLLLNEYIFSITYLDNDKLKTSVSILILFVVNISLDIIFSRFLYQDYKAFGIGLASSLSYICSCAYLLTHFFTRKSNFKIVFHAINGKYIKDSFTLGIPVGVKNLVITGRLYLLNFLMLTIGVMSIGKGGGDLVMAAHGIESNITNLFESGLGGLISTILMLGGVFYSEEDEKNLNNLLKEVFKFVFIIGGILSIIYFISAPYLVLLYSEDTIVIEQATFAMRASAVGIMFVSLAAGFLSFLQCCKKNMLANISTFLQSFLLPITFVCIFGFTIGVKGIWIGIPLGFIGYVVIHIIVSTIANKKLKIDVRNLFFLPKDFGFSKNESYDKEIYGIKDTYSLQKDVYDFCTRLGIDEKRKINFSNAAEELGVLIVLSGFTRKSGLKSKPHASIRVLYKKKTDTLIIRTRDNCNKFDIKEKIASIKENDNANNIDINLSLKILVNISKDIQYSQLLKTNNIIFKC